MNSAEEPRSFLFAFFVAATILVHATWLVTPFFLRSGENWPYRDLVEFQRSNDAVFAPAAPFDNFEYKLTVTRQVRPQVVVLGSSRALGFQGRYFKVPFVNAGQAMRSLEEGELFLSKLLEVHKPQNIVITVDFWWFNASTPPAGCLTGAFPDRP